jgi:dTDP-4-amino-4,6-dideoxygalactose transaminase
MSVFDTIPFNRPLVVESAYGYLRQAVARGHLSGDGPFTSRCRELLQEELTVPQALLTTSCTHALELAALLLDIRPGDEVIVPAYTFVSTVNAFVLRGARPVFADIRADTLNLDEARLQPLLNKRTRAIVPVHYAGVACEMDAIMRLGAQFGVAVVEDNAHGLFGTYRGRSLGTFGCLAAQSFHETKNFSCGEGGALLVNDTRFARRAEILREKGTNRTEFFRGRIDKYSWVDVGSSYLLSDALACLLYAQLEMREHIQRRRQQIWEAYDYGLRDWAYANEVRLPFVPAHCGQSFHMFYLLLPSRAERQALMAHLRARGIHSVFHYQPLHLSNMGRQLGGKPGDCPVTEDMSDRLLRLPFYTDLTATDLERVIAAICRFRRGPSHGRRARLSGQRAA